MKVEVKIDPSNNETKVVIVTDKMSEEVNELISKLSEKKPMMLVGFKDDNAHIIEPSEVLRVFASTGKVFAVTNKGEFILKQRLYEVEEKLDKTNFVRISNSEIINLKKVERFDLSLSGTICVELKDGEVTYVSRRFVTRIKKVLGI